MNDDVKAWSTQHLEDEVAAIEAGISTAVGRQMCMLAELERRGEWETQGFLSLAHWLAWRTGVDLPAAREKVRVARALPELPMIKDALLKGEISYSKARTMTRVAQPTTQAPLLEMAKDGTAAQLERIVRGVRKADPDADRELAQRHEDGRLVWMYTDDEGMLVLRARLAPEEGALLRRAFESARREVGLELEHYPDAFVRMIDRSLAAEGVERSGGDRTMVVLHVDEAVLKDPAQEGQCQLEDGPAISVETARQLACDCSVVEMKNGELGRRDRRLKAGLKRAVRIRDQHRCTYPGCTNRIIDDHHIIHWIDGGPTERDNITLLCRRHHRMVHKRLVSVTRGDDGIARFYRRDGIEIPRVPAPPPPAPVPPGDPNALTTTFTRDDGQVDYATAVGWALPPAGPASG